MKRRDFLASSSLAGLASATGLGFAAGDEKPARQLLELRLFHLLPGNKRKLMTDMLRDGALPALTRLGVGPIGVFEPVHGADSLTLYMLIPHKSLESVLMTPAKVMADAAYQKAAEPIYQLALSDSPYVRIESSLMVAFDALPAVEVPPPAGQKKPRIFEMRIYESHNGRAAKRKVEMFNAGGEIAIFKKTGLHPVFFGETVIGPRMPNLTYMCVFEDYAAREKAWNTFRDDPDWKKISTDPYYADTVSNITDILLRPTDYSQI